MRTGLRSPLVLFATVGSVMVGVLALAAVWAVSAGPATATPLARQSARPIVLHPKFHQIASWSGHYFVMLSTGRYIFLTDDHNAYLWSTGTVIDDQTGRRTAFSLPSSCGGVTGPGGDSLGGSWVMVDCANAFSRPDVWLYALSGGGWREVGFPASVESRWVTACESARDCEVTPVAVGTHWIEWDIECSEYCSPETRIGFTNVQTGTWRDDPANATTIADPNSRSLAVKVCRPLRVPKFSVYPFFDGTRPNYGSLTFYGRFAVVDSEAPGTNLERCGSHNHEPLGDQPVLGNSQIIAWNADYSSGIRPLYGVFLATGQRFMLTHTQYDGAFAIGPRHLYIGDLTGKVLSAVNPVSPPSGKHR